MGETGCGKTRLIRYMCGLQSGPKGPRNMLLVKVRFLISTLKQEWLSSERLQRTVDDYSSCGLAYATFIQMCRLRKNYALEIELHILIMDVPFSLHH